MALALPQQQYLFSEGVKRTAYHAHDHHIFYQTAEAARARRRLRALYVAIELIKAIQ
jgi:hypothetical protein